MLFLLPRRKKAGFVQLLHTGDILLLPESLSFKKIPLIGYLFIQMHIAYPKKHIKLAWMG